jgi:hypothetical protein
MSRARRSGNLLRKVNNEVLLQKMPRLMAFPTPKHTWVGSYLKVWLGKGLTENHRGKRSL